MITIFSHTDDDGDTLVAQLAHDGELCVEAFPAADPGSGYSVFVPPADVQRLIAALVQHWPASGGVVEPSGPLAAEAAPHCKHCGAKGERDDIDITSFSTPLHARPVTIPGPMRCPTPGCPTTKIHVQHDPGALIEEPDLYEQGEGA